MGMGTGLYSWHKVMAMKIMPQDLRDYAFLTSKLRRGLLQFLPSDLSGKTSCWTKYLSLIINPIPAPATEPLNIFLQRVNDSYIPLHPIFRKDSSFPEIL